MNIKVLTTVLIVSGLVAGSYFYNKLKTSEVNEKEKSFSSVKSGVKPTESKKSVLDFKDKSNNSIQTLKKRVLDFEKDNHISIQSLDKAPVTEDLFSKIKKIHDGKIHLNLIQNKNGIMVYLEENTSVEKDTIDKAISSVTPKKNYSAKIIFVNSKNGDIYFYIENIKNTIKKDTIASVNNCKKIKTTDGKIFLELYSDNNMKIYITDNLYKSITKDSIQKNKLTNLLNESKKKYPSAIIIFKRDNKNNLYFEVLGYDESIAKDSVKAKRQQDNNMIYYFNFSQTEINDKHLIPSFLKDLKNISTELGIKAITIIGYTDNIGSQEDNYELGLKRSHALDNLLSDYNITVTYLSKGELEPFVSNETAEGRALNRRIKILWGKFN